MENVDLERVAETHFFIRPKIEHSLSQTYLTAEGKARVGDYNTYLEFWRGSFADRFFDMSTMVRLGTCIEVGLRIWHRDHGGSARSHGFYQRLVAPAALVQAFKADCNYDLLDNPAFNIAREIMVHRHLYAHRSGLVDDRYISDIGQVCGSDLRPALTRAGYPEQETYWFAPLKRLPEYIEGARRFFRVLP